MQHYPWMGMVVGGLLLSVGYWGTFHADQVREYFYASWREGRERTGIYTNSIEEYAGVWVFRALGIAALLFGMAFTVRVLMD